MLSLANGSSIYKSHTSSATNKQHACLVALRPRNFLINTFTLRSGRALEAQSGASDTDLPPPGCARYSVTLSKPLGLVLEENKSAGTIVVADVVEGGNAERSGEITVGDTLIATSGYTRTAQQVYGETVVYGGETVVRLLCRGESFDTVMAAIGSHPAHIPVTLELQRCDL